MKKNCASSWLFKKKLYRDARSTEHKILPIFSLLCRLIVGQSSVPLVLPFRLIVFPYAAINTHHIRHIVVNLDTFLHWYLHTFWQQFPKTSTIRKPTDETRQTVYV